MEATKCHKCGETMTPKAMFDEPIDVEFPWFVECICGNSYMIMWGDWQYVSNEQTFINPGWSKETEFILPRTMIGKSTLTGTIYRGLNPIQTFVDYQDNLRFTDIGSPDPKAIAGDLDCEAGRLNLLWSEPPGDVYLVLSYEYNISGRKN